MTTWTLWPAMPPWALVHDAHACNTFDVPCDGRCLRAGTAADVAEHHRRPCRRPGRLADGPRCNGQSSRHGHHRQKPHTEPGPSHRSCTRHAHPPTPRTSALCQPAFGPPEIVRLHCEEFQHRSSHFSINPNTRIRTLERLPRRRPRRIHGDRSGITIGGARRDLSHPIPAAMTGPCWATRGGREDPVAIGLESLIEGIGRGTISSCRVATPSDRLSLPLRTPPHLTSRSRHFGRGHGKLERQVVELDHVVPSDGDLILEGNPVELPLQHCGGVRPRAVEVRGSPLPTSGSPDR